MDWKAKIIVSIGIVGQLTGCASIVSDNRYPVTFSTNPSGAEVTIRDENHRTVHRGVTPFTVTLAASDGYFDGMDYTASFQKPCYQPTEVPHNSRLDGWYVGNLIFGGLLGLIIVDPATGSMWRLQDSAHADLIDSLGDCEPS
ncbi:hypothetical protein [Methylohalobius crimeensis]|uniref:hypothetical protein n=1 Tax=Methylohalobius crimeensis TaxID=244365 RepID=UPI0003B2EE35|nr:hypothetical protein [Methylohalobius crimeensis]